MLNVTPFRQHPSFCGPASLTMVLRYYGIRTSERALGRIAGTTYGSGTTAAGLLRAARALGCRGHLVERATLADLQRLVVQRGIPVIVNWFSTDEGHYSVAVHVDHDNVYLQDPELGQLRAMKRDTFLRCWFDFDGAYPRDASAFQLRRMIVVEPPRTPLRTSTRKGERRA